MHSSIAWGWIRSARGRPLVGRWNAFKEDCSPKTILMDSILPVADRLSNKGKAILVEHTERQALLTDCLTMCKNIGLSMDLLDFDFASRLLTAGTGLKFTPEKVNEALKEGASKGQVVPVGRLVKEYYKAKGWDAQGVPQD